MTRRWMDPWIVGWINGMSLDTTSNRWLALQRSAVTPTAAGGYPRPAQASQERHRGLAGVLTHYSYFPGPQDPGPGPWHDPGGPGRGPSKRQHLIYHQVVVQGGDGLGVVVRRTVYVWTTGCP